MEESLECKQGCWKVSSMKKKYDFIHIYLRFSLMVKKDNEETV